MLSAVFPEPEPRIFEAGTDIAMVGLWDRAFDLEPFETRPSIPQLESEALDAKLFFVRTGADGSFPAWIYVEAAMPEAVLASTKPCGDWFRLRAPSGRLCFGGLEDYRRRAKQITRAEDHFEVPPGDYRVRCRVLDFDLPRRRIAAHLGDEEYARWKRYGRSTNRSCCLGLVALTASAVLGVVVDWGIGISMLLVAVVSWVLWERFGDKRGQELERKVMAFTGEKSLDELDEELAAAHPWIALELRRDRDRRAASMAGGFVDLRIAGEERG